MNSYQFKKVDSNYLKEYRKYIDDEDLKYLNYDAAANHIKKQYAYFLYILLKNDIPIGLFGIYIKTNPYQNYANTFLIHLVKNERGTGLGYLLQYLRMFLIKYYFPNVNKLNTTCFQNSLRAIKMYDEIYRIKENNKLSTKLTRSNIYYKYFVDIDFILKNHNNKFINFIKNNYIDSEIIQNPNKIYYFDNFQEIIKNY